MKTTRMHSWAKLLIIFLFFTSCVTERQRQRICNSCPVVANSKDSVVEKLKDTTLYITEKGPTEYLPNPCEVLCDSFGNLKPINITKKENGISINLKNDNKALIISADADSLKAIIKGLKEKEFYSKKEESEVKYLSCDKPHRKSFDDFCFWWFWITAGLLLIRGAYFLVKKYYTAQ